MPAVESVGGCVGAEQRCPGGPKFGTKSIVQPVPQGLKPRIFYRTFGTAEAAPLTKSQNKFRSDMADRVSNKTTTVHSEQNYLSEKAIPSGRSPPARYRSIR
jgi:hypothetical protein